MDAKTMVLLFAHASKAGALINSARGEQDALGPERDRCIARLSCEMEALLGERAPDAKASRLFLHQQQAQFRGLVGRLDQKHRADRLAADLGDPAVFARRVVRPDELRSDLGGERFKANVPAIFLGIYRAVPGNDPADVAGPMASQQEARGLLRRRLERLLDGGHGVDDGRALAGIQSVQQGGDHATRSAVEVCKRRAAPPGQCEVGGAAVGPRWLSRDDLAALQCLQGAAHESSIEPQCADQIGGGAALPFRNLVNDPRFLQRPGAVQKLRLDDAELAGVETAEAANGADLALQLWVRRLI